MEILKFFRRIASYLKGFGRGLFGKNESEWVNVIFTDRGIGFRRQPDRKLLEQVSEFLHTVFVKHRDLWIGGTVSRIVTNRDIIPDLAEFAHIEINDIRIVFYSDREELFELNVICGGQLLVDERVNFFKLYTDDKGITYVLRKGGAGYELVLAAKKYRFYEAAIVAAEKDEVSVSDEESDREVDPKALTHVENELRRIFIAHKGRWIGANFLNCIIPEMEAAVIDNIELEDVEGELFIAFKSPYWSAHECTRAPIRTIVHDGQFGEVVKKRADGDRLCFVIPFRDGNEWQIWRTGSMYNAIDLRYGGEEVHDGVA